jgi:hypothetical protein
VNARQCHAQAFSPSLGGLAETNHPVLGLLGFLIVVIIVLLLSGSNERLGWRR